MQTRPHTMPSVAVIAAVLLTWALGSLAQTPVVEYVDRSSDVGFSYSGQPRNAMNVNYNNDGYKDFVITRFAGNGNALGYDGDGIALSGAPEFTQATNDIFPPASNPPPAPPASSPAISTTTATSTSWPSTPPPARPSTRTTAAATTSTGPPPVASIPSSAPPTSSTAPPGPTMTATATSISPSLSARPTTTNTEVSSSSTTTKAPSTAW